MLFVQNELRAKSVMTIILQFFGSCNSLQNGQLGGQMGKRNCGPRHKWRNNKKHKENVWRTMEECPRESELFENYYRLQQIVPEDEWDQFIQTLVMLCPVIYL